MAIILLKNIIAKIFFYIEKLSWDNKYYEYRKKYKISNSFKFNGTHINFYGDGDIIIGDNSYIGNHSSIQAYNTCKVTIGQNCSISHYVKIYTMNRNPLDVISNNKTITKEFGDVTIGNGCWIGTSVFIKQGVTIGDNVVIGANSVVTKDIPSNSIYGGNRIIKYAQ